MNKREREQGKQGGSSGSASAPQVKRGRPIGSLTNSAAVSAIAAAADSAAPASLIGPTFQVHSTFADQNHKRIILALQSGLKSDLTWALNTLTVLSLKEKDEVRKDATHLPRYRDYLTCFFKLLMNGVTYHFRRTFPVTDV